MSGRQDPGLRKVEPELLDELPADDPRAQRSRRDLRRVNTWLGNVTIMAGRISAACNAPRRLVEIGAGDGTFMLRVAQQLGRQWPNLSVELVDRQNVVAQDTLDRLAAVGWKPQAIKADVFDWLAQPGEVDLIVSNLFLHHFDTTRAAELLRASAARTRAFVACEPRRWTQAWVAGALVGLIGCNRVTRHDATVSVRAGFRGQEISALWPTPAGWEMEEGEAGLFSHYFCAKRSERVPPGGT